MSGELRAYHNDLTVKAKFVVRMKAHVDANDLVRRIYWENGKGCGIGCTIHSDDHKAYETELGWPEWLAHLKDRIFEKMSDAAAREFPLRLLEAVPAGFSDWDELHHDFCIFLLRDICEFDRTKYPAAAATINTVIRLHEKRVGAGDSAWLKAREAADTAAYSIHSAHWAAEAATESATHSAWAAEAATESAARSAAYSAARSVARSAWAAEAAARSAQLAADAAARSAAWAAHLERSAAQYDRMGDWLIRRFWKEDGS